MCEDGEIDREARITEAVGKLWADRSIGPRARCFICDCVLTDPVSIDYGICPECWPDVRGVFQDDLDTPVPDDPEATR